MATVITNLLSAVPVFGQDLVESSIATNPFTLWIGDICTCFGNTNLNDLSVLPTVGTVSKHALKKGKKIKLEKKDYLLIPSPFIAFLVGLIDGDGYIQITRTTKGFIAIKLTICLSLEDLSTLEYIHSVLNLGKITIYPDNRNPICKLIINRTDLQEVIFPLLIHHGIFFLTNNRRAQFDLAMFIFKNDLKLFEKIPNKEIPTIFQLPKTALEFLNLAFFNNWLVGFTNAEGSFFIKNNNDGCFQLKQKIHYHLFEAFKLLFNTKREISIEKGEYMQFSLCSKTEIQKVINFFSFSGFHPLIGLKNIQYLKWLTNLKNSNRYKFLNFPGFVTVKCKTKS